ncbi:hypothetical protein BGZ57DRAFT_905813 [Hyaloscypha finlandica]|nr:hypothetical protein BGZ57DRAFT_905813 [Hyaloscypha finlandica]
MASFAHSASPPTEKAKTHRYSAEEWEVQKANIERLYLAENRPLKEVSQSLRDDYGFIATEKQLKSRLTKWGFDVKNLKGDTAMELARTKAKRALENKKSSFRVNRKPVDNRRIDRYLQRNAISEEQLLSMTSPVNAPSPVFSVYTPQSVQSPTPGSSTPGLTFQALSLMDPSPNRQPDVLPTISEEVPMFDPKTFQPLLKPLQAGWGNDVSVQKNASSTATPQHISYETPQPLPISDSPSATWEHGNGLSTASGNHSLEPLVEDPDSADHLYAASPLRHSPNPGSSMSALSIRDSTLDQHEPVLPSATIHQPSRPSTYDTFDWDIWGVGGSLGMMTSPSLSNDDKFIFNTSEHESELALDQAEEEDSTHDDPIKLLSHEIGIARQSKERGERSQAEREYCSAIQKYITNEGIQTEPLLRVAVSELGQCLDSCPTDEVPTAACICLDLLGNLIRASSSTTVICSMVLVAMKTLSGEYLFISGGLNLQRVIMGLDDLNIDLPILQALPSFFETMQIEPMASESCENRGFRFGLLSFACSLRSYLEVSSPHEDFFSTEELRQITNYLQRTKRSFEGTLSKLGLLVNKLHSVFVSFTWNNRYPTCYPLIEPPATELASACATAGWYREAETLFVVLRSSRSLEILGRGGVQRRVEISKQYCLYLKRRKCYAELLSELCDMHTHLAKSHSAGTWFPRHGGDLTDVTDLLNGVPLPYDQYVSSKKARKIGKLKTLLSEPTELTVQQVLNFDSAMSFDVSFQHDLVLERNKSKAMDDDESMEDCKSSNKFGVTYTESGMTGISFNYSDLYR